MFTIGHPASGNQETDPQLLPLWSLVTVHCGRLEASPPLKSVWMFDQCSDYNVVPIYGVVNHLAELPVAISLALSFLLDPAAVGNG